jgi:hypothetical protein
MLVALLAALLLAAACDEGPGELGGDGLDDGTNDTGANTSDCTSIEWGSGLNVGQTVANWTQPGYVGKNGGFEIDKSEVEFSLEDVNCDGHQAIVLMIGDTG